MSPIQTYASYLVIKRTKKETYFIKVHSSTHNFAQFNNCSNHQNCIHNNKKIEET